MEPESSRPARAGFSRQTALSIIVADPAWRRAVRRVEALCFRAARAGGGAGTVVLASDREVKRLNARHRGRNKATNVLTFDGGDIVLARGCVLREAQAAGRSVSHHLAHLVVHGALHLRGHAHDAAGEGRRMELAEARILHRIGVPNPWRNA
jgi:probable rRNA maturation factor